MPRKQPDPTLNALAWLTRDEAAAYARVHVSTIDRAIKSGTLESRKPGGRRVIARVHVDKWLNGGAMLALLLAVVVALTVLPLRGCEGRRPSGKAHHAHARRDAAVLPSRDLRVRQSKRYIRTRL